jgi:hypothetical protein
MPPCLSKYVLKCEQHVPYFYPDNPATGLARDYCILIDGFLDVLQSILPNVKIIPVMTSQTFPSEYFTQLETPGTATASPNKPNRTEN